VIETTTTYLFGPFVLVMLKRYEIHGDTAAKILADKVEMPLKVSVTLGDAQYELASTLYHLGRVWTSGHYVAKVAVRESENVMDYLCDDGHISGPTSHTDDFATSWGGDVGPPERPYMLLYKRREVPLLDNKPLPIDNLGNSCYANALVQFLRPLTVNLESVREEPWYRTWAASVAGGPTPSATSR
jgi:ubiquitin C-terminal hydrolase